MPIKLASTLPRDDDANGLSTEAADYTAPNTTVVAVCVFDVAKLITDMDNGETTPVLRIMRVEPIVNPEDKTRMADLATRAHQTRTGQTVLPLGMEDEMRAMFGNIDMSGLVDPTDPGDTPDSDL